MYSSAILFYGFLFFVCKYCYNNKIKIGYDLIYMYSFIQLKIKNYYSIKSIANIDPLELEYCVFDCLNDLGVTQFNELKTTVIQKPELVFKKKRDYKMIVYNADKTIDKVCFYMPILIMNFNYELSNVSFISFKIVHNNTEYDIKLSTLEYNFYIVNNIINFLWVKYYFKKFLEKTVFDTDTYSIHIVDEDIQFITLYETSSIIFEKDSYLIINN